MPKRTFDPYRGLTVFFALVGGVLAVYAAYAHRERGREADLRVSAEMRVREVERQSLARIEQMKRLVRADFAPGPSESAPVVDLPAVAADAATYLSAIERDRLRPERLLVDLRAALSGPVVDTDAVCRAAGALRAWAPLVDRLTDEPAVAANAFLLAAALPGQTPAHVIDLLTRRPIESPTVARAAAHALACAVANEPTTGANELDRLAESGLSTLRRIAALASAEAPDDAGRSATRLFALLNDAESSVSEAARAALRDRKLAGAIAPLVLGRLSESVEKGTADDALIRIAVRANATETAERLADRYLRTEEKDRRLLLDALTGALAEETESPAEAVAFRLLAPLRASRGAERDALLVAFTRISGWSAEKCRDGESVFAALWGPDEKEGNVAPPTADAALFPAAAELQAIESIDDDGETAPDSYGSPGRLRSVFDLARTLTSSIAVDPGMTASAPVIDGDAAVRAGRIAAFLAYWGHPLGIRYLKGEVLHRPGVRALALKRLMRCGWHAADLAAEAALDVQDPAAVFEWLELAASRGAKISRTAIERLLTDEKTPRRFADLLGQALLASADPEARAAVVEILLSGRTRFEAEVIGVCSLFGDPKTWPIVMERLTAGDTLLREAALRAARRYDLRPHVRELIQLAKDESPPCRAALAAALGDYEEPNAATTLYVLSHDASDLVREAAVRALAKNPGSRGVAVLKDRMDDEDAEVRNAAIRALATLKNFDRIPDLAKDADDPLLGPRTRRFLEAAFRRPVGKVDEWLTWWTTVGRALETQ